MSGEPLAAQAARARALLTAAAVREHCGEVMACIERDGSRWFAWDASALDGAAAFVEAVIRERHPDLRIPFHSRWRHFEAGGVDRWARLAHGTALRERLLADPLERARAMLDLVVPSVLLDAGAGPAWHYRDGDAVLSRSEGLAVASLELVRRGALSSDPDWPCRADAVALRRVSTDTLADVFQVDAGNPLLGLAGRAELLRSLGRVVADRPDVFGAAARVGNLVDHLRTLSTGGRLEAATVLRVLLDALGPAWPGRLRLGGVELGDTWPHPAATGGLVPFHKLSQWLAYSLLEPLQVAGLEVVGLDALTGLPEYRNGGLLIDTGLLRLREPSLASERLAVDHPAVVEWRSATVVALDRLADAVRRRLGRDAAAMPLVRVLEGGTWVAGRRLAAARRAGAPPLQIDSDGTVF
ncbi:MAG TPA: DUF1688 family protein [Burkholderiaceae bacterium]|nr:DUF1688 family protein [Burkholderiaceae bacterium]